MIEKTDLGLITGPLDLSNVPILNKKKKIMRDDVDLSHLTGLVLIPKAKAKKYKLRAESIIPVLHFVQEAGDSIKIKKIEPVNSTLLDVVFTFKSKLNFGVILDMLKSVGNETMFQTVSLKKDYTGIGSSSFV